MGCNSANRDERMIRGRRLSYRCTSLDRCERMFDVADAKGLYGRWFVYASRASEELGNENLVGFADLK